MRRSVDGLTEAEIDRARAQMKAGMLMGLESPSARAERLARLVAIWDRVPPLQESIDRINAVDRAAVRDHAAALVGAGRAALALYGPVDRGPRVAELVERLAA